MHEIIFVNEFLQDDTDLDVDVFRAVKGCSEVEVGEIMVMNCAFGFKHTLLKSSLAVSSKPVCVPQSPGYAIVFPPMVIHVQLGSSLAGWCLQTTLVWVTSLIQSGRMSWK